MLKLLCYSLFFFSIAQPGILFPSFGENLFFILAGAAVGIFFFKKFSHGERANKLPQNKFVYGMLFAYTLSEAQFMWLSGTIQVFLFWFKKILLYFLFVNVINEEKDIRRSMWAIVLAVLVLTWYAWDIYWNYPQRILHEGRLQSVGNYNLSNSFAFLLSLAFPIVFSLLEAEESRLRKFFLLGTMVLVVISSLYTKSRGGYLGLLIAITLSALLSRKVFKTGKMKAMFVTAVVVLFLSYAVAFVLTRPDVSSFTGKGGEASSGDRLLAWSAAIKMAIDHPLFGVGWGKFNESVRDYGHDKKLIAHNTLLSVLAETGLFGFICFCGLLFTSLKQLWAMTKRWRSMEEKTDLLILSQGTLISFVCFCVNSSFSVKDHDPIYWAVLSLSGALCAIYRKEQALEAKDL